MSEKKVRVALLGRLYDEDDAGESIESQKEILRTAAKNKNCLIVDEFWEENVSPDCPLEDRTAIRRLLTSVWNNELIIDGVFMARLTDLGWTNRKEHLTLITFFEQNNLSIVTFDETYDPDVWIGGCSL
ncbi:MAG: recombinase family protein [Deltaproteobacteria bacterium]|nr:recombinase family protein [Deltaproteobacteria bacterium]